MLNSFISHAWETIHRFCYSVGLDEPIKARSVELLDCRPSIPRSAWPYSLILYNGASQRALEVVDKLSDSYDLRKIKFINLDGLGRNDRLHLPAGEALTIQLKRELNLESDLPFAVYLDDDGNVVEHIIGDSLNDPFLILMHRFRTPQPSSAPQERFEDVCYS